MTAVGKPFRRRGDLHTDALICDLTLPWIDVGRRDLRERTLPRFGASGFDFVSLTLASDAESQIDVFNGIARERSYLLNRPEQFRLVETVDDILASKRDGRLALSFNLQGTNAFAGNLDMVETFYKLGVRQALMAYNKRNLVGDGCHERSDCGLSQFGVDLVRGDEQDRHDCRLQPHRLQNLHGGDGSVEPSCDFLTLQPAQAVGS